MIFVRRIFRSFRHAWHGLVLAFRTERSFRFHTAATCIVFLFIAFVPLRGWERALLVLATASVLVLELVNSMMERLVDLVKPRIHTYVRDIKDLMAAAVFVASLSAVVLGVFVLWPYIVALFR